MKHSNNAIASNNELLSKTISFLRFPLIVGVVFIHANIGDVVINGQQLVVGNHFLYDNFNYLISNIFAAAAVPLFFVISGYLFFYGIEQFTTRIYLSKLKKRARTLLIPYIFWNLLVIILFFLLQTFFPELTSGKNTLIKDYTFHDWLCAFGCQNTKYPICFQFWFIRDLMMMVLCSPVIWFIIKTTRQWAIYFLGVMWVLFPESGIPGFSLTAIFFFSTGAYLGINTMDFASRTKQIWKHLLILYFISSVVVLYFREYEWCTYLHSVNILVGIVAIVATTAHFIDKGKWVANQFLSNGSFFIYAYHGMFLALCIKLAVKVIQPHSDLALILLYLTSPMLIIVVGLACYGVLRQYLPRFTALITGGR